MRLLLQFNNGVALIPCNRPPRLKGLLMNIAMLLGGELLFAITLLCVIELMYAACFRTRS